MATQTAKRPVHTVIDLWVLWRSIVYGLVPITNTSTMDHHGEHHPAPPQQPPPRRVRSPLDLNRPDTAPVPGSESCGFPAKESGNSSVQEINAREGEAPRMLSAVNDWNFDALNCSSR